MAKSGSNTTWSSNGGHYVKVTWNETSQSTTENRSAVTVRLYVGSKSGWSISDSSNSYSLIINGTTYSGSNASISHTGGENLIMTQSVMIYHNSDGTKSFSMRGAVSGLYFGGITGSTFSGTLDTIARASTMSSSANMTAGWAKTVSISRASSSFNHIVQVYVTRGATEKLIRTESFSTSETSKTLEWSNTQIKEMFNSGYGYWTGTKFILTTRSGTTSIGTNTYTGSLDWPNNNSVGSMENSINAGGTFNVNINKASSLYSHEAKLTLSDGTSLATRNITSGSSFPMTPLASTIYSRAASSASIGVELWIRTVLTADTATEVRGWTREKTSTVYIPNSPPSMGTMSYTELNTTVATAIGSSGTNPPLVQGYSHPRFTFTASTAQNSATIVNYTVSIGGESLSRTTAGTLDFTPANLGGRTIKVGANTNAILTATDSRGFTNSISIPVTYLAYTPPMVTVNVKRVNGFSDSVELTGSATISSLGGKNSVATSGGFRYRERILPAAFGTAYTNASSTTVNGIPTLTKVTRTISNESAYEFEVVVTDKITSTAVRRAGSPGKPIAFMDSKLLSVGVNRFPTGSRRFEVQDEMMISPGAASAKIAPHFAGNTNKSIIRFEQVSGSNDPGMIVHETSPSSTSADNNKGVIHLMPSDDLDNANDYVTVRSTNFTQAERVRIYSGGNAWFNGVVSVGELSTTKINVVGTNLEIANSSAEMLKLTANSGTYGYMSIYNGTTRVGYFGSISNNSTSVRVVSDGGWLDLLGQSGVNLYVAGTSRLHLNSTTTTLATDLNVSGNVNPTKGVSFAGGYENVDGNVYYNGSRLRVRIGGTFRNIAHEGDSFDNGSASIEGSLIHNSGYMHISVFNKTSSHYSTAGTSTQRGELYYSGTTNQRFIFLARTNDGATTTASVQAGAFPTSSSIKYKEAIDNYQEDALQKIMETNIKTYRFKGHPEGARKVGVIIEEGVPEEIVEITRDAIDSYSMVSMSWKAIQQIGHELFVKDEEIQYLNQEQERMKKEKTAMKTRMTKLEKKNKELEDRLARIEALLEGGG